MRVPTMSVRREEESGNSESNAVTRASSLLGSQIMLLAQRKRGTNRCRHRERLRCLRSWCLHLSFLSRLYRASDMNHEL